MKFFIGKQSNYIGQTKDKLDPLNKTDTYLVSVERDLSNLFNYISDIVPAIGTTRATLNSSTSSGFLYIPVIDAAPTGTPTVYTGHYAMCYCAADDKIYVYIPTANWVKTGALT